MSPSEDAVTKAQRLFAEGRITLRYGVVRLSQIVADPDLNRPLNQGFVDYLVVNWDQSLVGEIIAAAHEGGYIVGDGQHRLEAMRQMNAEDIEVPVLLIEGMTKAHMVEAHVMLTEYDPTAEPQNP